MVSTSITGRTPGNYDFDRFFQGMPPCHRCLLETRRQLAPTIFDEGTRCVTTSFWNDGEYLTAADPWEVVWHEGARLVRIELLEDIDAALAEWQVEMEMKPEQVAFTRSLFLRKVAEPTKMLELTQDELEWLRSTSADPKDDNMMEERMKLCRNYLAALRVLLPVPRRLDEKPQHG
jgi:hypothetical protein